MGSQGRQNWNSKAVRELRQKLKLSDWQKSVLIGKILGDGSLVPTFTGKNFRLKIEQQVKHREYVEWTEQIFHSWVISGIKFIASNNSLGFRTISHPELTMFRNKFYTDHKKIIPADLKTILTHPVSLAVWFMDDGGLSTSKKAVTISTHCYSKNDNYALIECLKENFGIQINLNWDGKGNRLYFPVNTAAKFKQIVQPYILPLMRYKLPLTP